MEERVVATLRLRIRTLEEVNRELKEQLETAYGRLAVVPPKPGSCTESPRHSGYVAAANPTSWEVLRGENAYPRSLPPSLPPLQPGLLHFAASRNRKPSGLR